MIELDVSGIDAFLLELDRDMAKLDRGISNYFYKWTTKLFTELVTLTPQYSGDLAANWTYAVKTPNLSYIRIPNKTGDATHIDYWRENQGVFERGHPYAVNMALSRMSQVPRPVWRDIVYFANSTPISQQVEDESIKIRPVNLVEGHVVMARQLAAKYGGWS